LLGIPKSERADGELERSTAPEISPVDGMRRSAFEGLSGTDPDCFSE
jgi:hypothetical protein